MPVSSKRKFSIDDNLALLLNILFKYSNPNPSNTNRSSNGRYVFSKGVRILL